MGFLTRASRTTHKFAVLSHEPQRRSRFGSRIDVTAHELPALKGMALSHLTVDVNGVREPHWHPNAHELSYCLEGAGLLTIFGAGNVHDTFSISPGDIAFIPMGYLHHIENTGQTPLKLLLCFNHEEPETFDITSSVAAMPDHVMGETFDQSANYFSELKKNSEGVFASQLSRRTTPLVDVRTSRYKMNLEAVNPQVQNRGGWAKMSNDFALRTLEDLALYSLMLARGGAREPHWHPNASELNYLIRGSARVTLLSPDNQADTFTMKAGDMSFLPRGYPHYIENTGEEEAHFAIFFNHSEPSDIGISGCFGAYSNEVLASVFGASVDFFDRLPKFQQDLLIVGGG